MNENGKECSHNQYKANNARVNRRIKRTLKDHQYSTIQIINNGRIQNENDKLTTKSLNKLGLE